MATEVRVPTLGESVTEATVATWYKKLGDSVAVDEMLCELETDKVTVEVPSPVAGILTEIVAQEGQTVGAAALLAQIGAQSEKTGAVAPQPDDKSVKAEASGKEGKMTDVNVPTLGESVSEATVSTWFKKVGDVVAQDEMLCELETDKVSVEVPSPVAGVLSEILAAEGETVAANAKLAVIAEGETAKAKGPKTDVPKAGDAGGEEAKARTSAEPKSKDVEDAPSAKKAMAETGMNRDQVQGSGRDGRVMKEDVARAAPVPAPTAVPRAPVPADDASREERVKMTKLRQTIARRLKESQNTAAMLTTYNEVDMSAVMDLRSAYKDQFEKKHKVKLGFMSFFVKACTHALKEVPEVNAEIDGTEVIYKNYVHMGVAVGTPNGLVVPVVRDADAMGFAAIEKKISELGLRARDGKLSMAEMQGGSFTI
jgi:2-oxoglutarate dehydrogenase E2 component (dihydrolipoamide succinyltransferase)